MAPLYHHVSHEELKNMTIFSIVIEDVANNYRMPREKISSLRNEKCVWRVLSINVQEKKKNFKKRLQQLFNDEKKYLEKWF